MSNVFRQDNNKMKKVHQHKQANCAKILHHIIERLDVHLYPETRSCFMTCARFVSGYPHFASQEFQKLLEALPLCLFMLMHFLLSLIILHLAKLQWHLTISLLLKHILGNIV
ncbi:hypothetical protein ROZALSC1DRAFT_26094 [Rozella allomycis CSF55]|uniref:Uncharacterized protein n=1 Tax=Rozella allomycis (strain CSF55) TaxID=988480 RepID=A0A4P9Y9A6_ROZAC|nr:hypothetical protein ROZALSC1DRAFT_26094 [Rozella allomycis CSF55]